ncbi:hypothetical protein G9C98_008229 [Cotesia typhae]|uniref:Uncharacterized protein n=1 Tax=Cotesia typhae TaxID=2053667 RepID=A0A8J5V035_9HYME|nr:hypothetical protein G9C98_008229 [Cotesia typhae]
MATSFGSQNSHFVSHNTNINSKTPDFDKHSQSSEIVTQRRTRTLSLQDTNTRKNLAAHQPNGTPVKIQSQHLENGNEILLTDSSVSTSQTNAQATEEEREKEGAENNDHVDLFNELAEFNHQNAEFEDESVPFVSSQDPSTAKMSGIKINEAEMVPILLTSRNTQHRLKIALKEPTRKSPGKIHPTLLVNDSQVQDLMDLYQYYAPLVGLKGSPLPFKKVRQIIGTLCSQIRNFY